MRETNHEKLPLMLEVKDFERAFMDYIPARQAYPNALEIAIEAEIFVSTQNPMIVETLDISADDLAVYFFENAHKYGIKV